MKYRRLLIYWCLVKHICIDELGHRWLRQWLFNCSTLRHYLNRCQFIANCTPRHKLQSNLNHLVCKCSYLVFIWLDYKVPQTTYRNGYHLVAIVLEELFPLKLHQLYIVPILGHKHTAVKMNAWWNKRKGHFDSNMPRIIIGNSYEVWVI